MAHMVEWDGNNVMVQLSGAISLSEITDVTIEVNSDDRFVHMKYSIYDFTNVSDMISKNRDFSNIVQMDKSSAQWKKQLKIANVSNNRDILEVTEEYAIRVLETSWDVQNFATIDEARAWCCN